MASVKSESDSTNSDDESEFLDPRIQVELERLNTCTDEINKLETELDEANTTFRMLLNESMRRLKVLTCKLGSCIDRARPYYEAVDIAKKAQAECQRAAVKFQRANEIHQAAKETVALAETRFLSNQHEWQFDSAWQEMLNHAIIKVTEAEHQRTESGQEHQKRATLFNVAEQRVAMLEQKLKRTIIKSRPYFEEKALCQEQLDTQKKRVEELQVMISKVKSDYSGSLKRLEAISEEIHQRRRNKSGSASPLPRGPREPGVGAELDPKQHEEIKPELPSNISYSPELKKAGGDRSCKWSGDDLENELDKFEVCSLGSLSVHTSSHVSESEDFEDDDLDELRQKVKELSMAEVRSDTWETELAESILRLDNAMLERECNRELRAIASKPCGSPLREQDCNRELTAIVSGIASLETAEQSAKSSDTADTSESDGVSDNTSVNVDVKNGETSDHPSGEKLSGSKSLEMVLAEEESKRVDKLALNSTKDEIQLTSNVESQKLQNPLILDNQQILNSIPEQQILRMPPQQQTSNLDNNLLSNLKNQITNSNQPETSNIMYSSNFKPKQTASNFEPKVSTVAHKVPAVTPPAQIEQLSAVALNQMVNEKEASYSLHNTPTKSLNSGKLNLESDSLLVETNVNLNCNKLINNSMNGVLNKLDNETSRVDLIETDKTLESQNYVDLPQTCSTDKPVKLESQNSLIQNKIVNNECVERRQSIGATASKILNSAKIESLRANLNENILHTIKDVSESVLNRLVRQDSKDASKYEQILTQYSPCTSILNINYNPFSNKNNEITSTDEGQQNSSNDCELNSQSLNSNETKQMNPQQSFDSAESNSVVELNPRQLSDAIDNNQSVKVTPEQKSD